jgi:predicted PurR-regulated permease PerM
MTSGWRLTAWLVLLTLGGLILWLLSPVLLPFLLGMGVAYLLDPVVQRLEAWGAPRSVAAFAVIFLFLVVVGVSVAFLVPVLENQLAGLIQRLIEAVYDLANWLRTKVEDLPLALGDVKDLNAGEIAGKVISWMGGAAASVWSGGLALFHLLSLALITPIVAFYLLRDWPRIVTTVDGWLPRDHAETIREQLRLIDLRLSGFVRGQALVCLTLGIFYALALTIAGLNYGLLVGLLTGLLIFIPFLGGAIGFAVAITIALFQFDSFVPTTIVAAIFFVGQFGEAYIISPKLVGDRIGLHPVWLVLALLAGGALFGFVGVLIAVPAAATIGVLLRFALQRYLAGPLYRGGGASVRSTTARGEKGAA